MRPPVFRRAAGRALAGALVVASGPLAAALADSLPLRRDPPAAADASLWLPSLLLLVLALAGFAWSLWRRGKFPRGWRPAAPPAAVLGRRSSQALTPHASVHVVRWQGEEYLLGCTPQQVTLLARMPLAGEGERE